MAQYVVVCAKREACLKSPGRFHVTALGTGHDKAFDRVWAFADVRWAQSRLDRFCIKSPETGQLIELKCIVCRGCFETETLDTGSIIPSLNVDSLPQLERIDDQWHVDFSP